MIASIVEVVNRTRLVVIEVVLKEQNSLRIGLNRKVKPPAEDVVASVSIRHLFLMGSKSSSWWEHVDSKIEEGRKKVYEFRQTGIGVTMVERFPLR